jgi:hypothetical protein
LHEHSRYCTDYLGDIGVTPGRISPAGSSSISAAAAAVRASIQLVELA